MTFPNDDSDFDYDDPTDEDLEFYEDDRYVKLRAEIYQHFNAIEKIIRQHNKIHTDYLEIGEIYECLGDLCGRLGI